MMKFTSGCRRADLPGSSKNKVDKFRINQKKQHQPIALKEKADKFRINLTKSMVK